MSGPQPTDDDDALDILLLRLRDGTLDEAGIADLRQRLADPAGRAAFVRHALLSTALAQSLRPAQPRIRRSHAARPRHVARRWWTWGAGLAAAGILVAIVLLSGGRDAVATVIQVAGAGAVGTDADGSDVAVAVGRDLPSGVRLKTGAARVMVRLAGEDTLLALEPDATVGLALQPAGRVVGLAAGTLEARVAAQDPGRPLRFRSPHVEVTVVGTRLHLTAERQGTTIAVDEGHVRWRSLIDAASGDLTTGASRRIAAPVTAPSSATPVLRPAIGMPATGCLWGLGGRTIGLEEEVRRIEGLVGRRLAVVHQYLPSDEAAQAGRFPTAAHRRLAADGRLLLFTLRPQRNDVDLPWSEIAAGRWDKEQIDPLARQAATWKAHFLIALQRDPDLHAGTATGMSPEDYVRMWRHVRERFRRAGAGQVGWVWSVSGLPGLTARWDACYPGDDQVDWLSCSTAHDDLRTPQRRPDDGPDALVRPFLDWIVAAGGGRAAIPILVIAQPLVSSADRAGWFAGWQPLVTRHPAIRAIVHIHASSDDPQALRVDRDAAALRAFATAANNPPFTMMPGDR